MATERGSALKATMKIDVSIDQIVKALTSVVEQDSLDHVANHLRGQISRIQGILDYLAQ